MCVTCFGHFGACAANINTVDFITQVARAYFLQQSMPGGDLNGAGRSKSEQAGWILAIDRGGRITPEKRIQEQGVQLVADASRHPVPVQEKRPKTSLNMTARSYTTAHGTNVHNYWRKGKPAADEHAPVALDQKTFQRAASVCGPPSFEPGKISSHLTGKLQLGSAVLPLPSRALTRVRVQVVSYRGAALASRRKLNR